MGSASTESTGAASQGRWLKLLDIFSPPLGPDAGEEQRREYRTVVAFIFIGAVIIFGFGRLNASLGNVVPAVVEQITTVVLIAMLFVIRRGHVHVAAHVAIFATTLTIFLAMWYGGGTGAAAIVFLPMLPAVGLLSIGRSGGLAGLIQAVAIVAVIAIAERAGLPLRDDPPDKLFVKRVAESIVVVVQIWALCLAFFNLKDEAFKLLSKSRDEIADLLNNMRQGVLAIGRDGRIAGKYSEQAKAVFGREKLDETCVEELLYAGVPEYDVERQNFVAWLDGAFAADPDTWEDLTDLAPKTCVRHGGTADEQHLKLEFRPILDDGVLARVMLLVTDETESVKLRRAADAEKAVYERMMKRLRRLAASGAHTFLEFLRSAASRIDELEKAVAGGVDRQLSTGEVEYFFRQAHTIKGEARTYDLESLEQAMGQLEEVLEGMRERALGFDTASTPVDATSLTPLLHTARAQIDEARANLIAVSPIGAAILDQVTVRRSDLVELRERVVTLGQSLGSNALPLMEVTARLSARPFGEATSGLVDGVQRWAEQRGKRAALNVTGKEVLIDSRLADILPGVLAQLARNAVAHGVELPQARVQAGKHELGVIQVECTEGADGPIIVVEDDGAGIDVERLASRARQRSVESQNPLDLIFADGVSTTETTDVLSGRGVGMSAVREALRGIDYEIEVTSERGCGTRFVLRPSKQRRPSILRYAK